jgi:hypothetical protein
MLSVGRFSFLSNKCKIKQMKIRFLPLLVVIFCFAATESWLFAQSEQLDGRNRIFRDELLDNLVGNWKLTRKIRGQTVENTGRLNME